MLKFLHPNVCFELTLFTAFYKFQSMYSSGNLPNRLILPFSIQTWPKIKSFFFFFLSPFIFSKSKKNLANFCPELFPLKQYIEKFVWFLFWNLDDKNFTYFVGDDFSFFFFFLSGFDFKGKILLRDAVKILVQPSSHHSSLGKNSNLV